MVLDTYSFAFSQTKNAQNLNGKNSQLSYLKNLKYFPTTARESCRLMGQVKRKQGIRDKEGVGVKCWGTGHDVKHWAQRTCTRHVRADFKHCSTVFNSAEERIHQSLGTQDYRPLPLDPRSLDPQLCTMYCVHIYVFL